MERSHAVVNGLTRSVSRPGADVDRQDFKLLIDPAIKKGHAKIFRYNGVFPGQPPVIPRDPRSRRTRIWTLNKADLPVPNFKVDDCYVGIPPQREVLFSSLNDNVDKKFLQQMCERYGKIDAIKIYFDPQTKRHTGKGRVTFSTTTAAKMAAAKLNHTSVMGNIIKAQLEPNIKVLEVHASQRGCDHPPTRRIAGHETAINTATVMPPVVVCRSLSHLSTPSPSVMSQSPSTDGGPVSSPSLLLIRSSATSGRVPGGDMWSTTFNNSWDRTAASAIKASHAGSAFLSPQSLSSGHSGFEPVSPPHGFQANEVPPPPPPPSSNPPPPPMERGSLSDPPPPPPDEKPLSCSSYMKFEDISPVPVFSPEDEGKTSKEKVDDNTLSKSNRRDCTHNSSPSNKVHSPHSDRSEGLKTWEKRKQYERDDRTRDKYRDCHKYNRPDDRDRKYDKHGDHRHKRDNYFDRKDDKRDHHRRNDYERHWTSGHWDRDDYKHRKDKYNTSPRRGEDHRKADTKESRGRDPRLRDRDNETSDGRDSQSKEVRDRDERDGRDSRCRDPRLRGRNMDSDTPSREKKAKDWETDGEPSETRNSINKDSRCRESEIKNVSARDSGVKEFEGKLRESDYFKSKVRDPRLQEKVNGSDSIYHEEHERHLDLKDSVSRQKENCESEARVDEGTSKDEQLGIDSALKKSTSKVVTAAEIASTLMMTSAPSAEAKPSNRYSDDAYTIGVDTCSDEEPLPPGYERDVAHEVQLEITRNKIKAAQNAVKKRKFSEPTQEDKLDVGAKAKKIQIVLKSVQLNSSETEQSSSLCSDTLSKEEECIDEGRGGWRCVSLVANDKATPEVAADVAISSSEAEESTVALVNLPLTEDISPCNSPALETSVQVESNDAGDSELSKPSKEPNDLYSDIDANDDDNDVGNVDNIDDDAMSLSSISSNEDTLEVNKPDQELLSKPKPISVPPPGVVFPPYPPPIFNPSIPPPLIFNPLVPPPPLGPVTVPPPPLPSVPTVPPPVPPPTIPPPSLPPTSLPPRSIPPPQVPPPSIHPLPVPPVPIPPPVVGAPPGFFDKRAAPPPFPSGGYPNGGGFNYQKVEQKKPWRSRIIDEVYRLVYNELDMVITRDIFKKLVEASAFKALESWWDNQTKPKGSAATTASSSRNLPMYEHPPATVGLPSNSGGVASTIGPSPFERPASLVLGLRASLPKLPSFKVKRPPEPPKSEGGVDSSARKRINTESPVMHGQEVKKRCTDGREADLETDTDLDSSWDKRPRTISKVEDEERSQSPWQQLDDSMDIAPPATRVRSSEADERRPSTGSSLYHTVYSSSSSSSSSESESEESGSDEDDEEEREEEEESEEDTDEDESESDEDSEVESEREEHQRAESKMEESTDVDREIEDNQGVAQTVVTEKQEVKQHSPISPMEASVRLPSPAWNSSTDSTSARMKLDTTVQATIVPQTKSPTVDRKDQTEQFRSFHIANIVPDLFKSQEDASQSSTQSVDRNICQTEKTGTERDNNGLESESLLRDTSAQRLALKLKNDSRIVDVLRVSDGAAKDEQSWEIPEVKTPICSPGFGLQDEEEINIRDEESEMSDDADVDQSSGMFEERMPLLSPDKPLAVSLIELDHSYGLAIPEEPRVRIPLDEPEVFDAVEHEPTLARGREFTESPVLDVVGLDSLSAGRPLLELVTPKPQFPVRSFEADDELVFEFLKLGVDSEDANFLKVGFEQLQQVGSESVMDAHWSDHPSTAQPASTKRRKQKTEHGVRVHVTGCARAEGFYKIDINEKAKYLQAQRRQLQCQANVNKEEQRKTDGNKAKQQSREHRAIQRRLQSAVCNEEFGDLLKFNQLMVRKKQLRFAKSGIHDWGLFALESIAADEMVTEYVGEIIRQPMADIRERRYEEMGIGSSYLFRVDQDTIIDATTKGNFARFINHCCDPNCYAKIVTVENAKKIVIYSKRDIAVNEEITYDYKFPIEDEKIPCLCGVAQCRGTLN